MAKTPNSVTILSILGIGFGVCGLCAPVALVPYYVDLGMPNPGLDLLRNDVVYMTVIVVQVTVAMLVTLLLLASSIGSLQLRPWGRMGMLIQSWICIVAFVAGLLFNFLYVVPLVNRYANNDRGLVAVAVFSAIFGAVVGLIALTYPVCILYYFTRPHVVNAFRGISSDEEDREAGDREWGRDEEYDHDDDRDLGPDDRIRPNPR